MILGWDRGNGDCFAFDPQYPSAPCSPERKEMTDVKSTDFCAFYCVNFRETRPGNNR